MRATRAQTARSPEHIATSSSYGAKMWVDFTRPKQRIRHLARAGPLDILREGELRRARLRLLALRLLEVLEPS